MSKKVAIVTGASSGIGKATAIQLNKEGYTVFAGSRRVEQMRDLEKIGIKTLKLDVTDEKSNQDFVDFVRSTSSSIDVIVNSAGYGSLGALEDVPLQEARNQFNVNVFGAMNLTQLILPIMRKQKSGKIINISSIGGQIYSPLGGWYYASKHALETLSDTLRNELKPFGIDVIIIEPGGTDTGWQEVANEAMKKSTPDNSAYRKLVEGFAAMSSDNYATSPDKIASLILKSIKDKKPKTRYQPRVQETMIVLAARKLPYKLFDRVIEGQMKRMMK
ncbi:MAG: SDR family NAD(P)-dependent oxidoreductase [Gorillibacterium sp.]|nr:SDR family NAD(P)-dependent oxidoreductase [Gorillibacterium sp.]